MKNAIIVSHTSRTLSLATYFEFLLADWINCLSCDWSELLRRVYLEKENTLLKMFI